MTGGIKPVHLYLYALPWLAVQVVQLPMINFVPGYYSSALGVPMLAISGVLLASRFLDIFTDPLIGIFSDRTKTRFGRRKVWIAAGAPVLALGAWLLFVPPANADALYLFIAISVAYLGFTMVQIPFVAWGAELSGDYDTRSRIAGWREGVGVLGTLCAISTPLLAHMMGYTGLAPALFALAVAAVILIPVLLAPALAFVPEPKDAHGGETPLNFITGLKAVGANREFLWFAAACFITFLGVAPGGATGYLMMKYTFNAEGVYPFIVVAEFVAMLVCLPFWVWLATKIGKHRAIAIGMLTMAAFTFPIPWVGLHDPNLVTLFSALRGIGFGAIFVLPYAMFADVIDVDTLRTGHNRSGLYMAFGGMNLKFALMFGTSLAIAWPAWFGFDPNAAHIAPEAAFQVAVSYAWITCFFLLLAAPLFWLFPLTRARQEANRAELARRAER
jgi:Na+/melibiose symporter-like transporter